MRTILVHFTLLLTSFVLVLALPRTATAADAPRTVLLFLPEDATTPGVVAMANGVRTSVERDAQAPVTFSVEHLDLGWFESSQYEVELRNFYRAKYRSFRPDVIVAIRSDTIPAVLDLRSELWPGVPLALIAEDERTAARLSHEENLTGVWLKYDIRATIEHALVMLPKTRRVALVLGSSPWDRGLRREFDDEFRPLSKRIDLIDLSGLSSTETERRLGTLPDDSIVLFHSFWTDSTGKRFVPAWLLDHWSPVTPTPIFSVHGSFLGHGIVGGVMVDYDALGRDLGRVTSRLLRGEPASSIPFHAAESNVIAFDARALERFRIPERLLPSGSEIRFREPSLWERYRWHVIGAGTGSVLQGFLIAVLLVERRKRGRAQASLAEQLRLEKLMADISAAFASLHGNRVDEQIETSLRRIGEFLRVDCCTLWMLSTDGQQWVPSTNWRAEGIDAHKGPVSTADFPVHVQCLKQGEIIFFRNVEEIVDEPTINRAAFERLALRSAVIVPIAPHGNTRGVVAVATVRREHPFSAEIAYGLRAFGELLSAVLQRKESEATLARMNRISAIDELAPSLAHELNQPLAVILTTAQTIERQMDRQDMNPAAVREGLADIVAADKRAGKIIRRMRALIKKGDERLERYDLNDVARDAAKLANSEVLRRSATLSVLLDPSPLHVRGDEVQLQQVVLNLISNALDAVEERPRGQRCVTVATKASDKHAEIVVSDSGSGVEGRDLERIFEPFYTTKAQGLGMGLSICRSIAEAHGGRLWAEKASGEGTSLRFVLPIDVEENRA